MIFRQIKIVLQNPDRILHYIRVFFNLSKKDIIIASYPRSGNTWLRYILCNILSLQEMDGQTISFKELDDIMPVIEKKSLFSEWKNKSLPRFLKTHQGYNPIFKNARKVVLLRDPRDVMASFFNYAKNNKNYGFTGTFSEFISDDRLGLEAWFQFHDSWMSKSDTSISYEDLLEDDFLEVGKLLKNFNIKVSDETLREACARAKFDKFKSIEKKFGTDVIGNNINKNFKFARKGSAGDFVNYFSTADMDYYLVLAKKYPRVPVPTVSPDLELKAE